MRAPILILTWNGWERVCDCLRSLSQTHQGGEIWIVDNGSRKFRLSEARRLAPDLRLVEFKTNLGWAGAYNRALGVAVDAGCDRAYLLNDDALVDPAFLASADAILTADSRLAAVGSVILFSGSNWVKFDGNYHSFEHKQYTSMPNRSIAATELNGAGMLVRLSAMQRDGFFDERFFCYGEETEWCWRMLERGWRLAVASGSIVYHQGQGSDVNANAAYYRSRNPFLLLGRHPARTVPSSRWTLTLALLNEARRYWISGDMVAFLAVSTAIYDGRSGKFGPREDTKLPLMFRLLIGGYVRLGWIRRQLGLGTRLRRFVTPSAPERVS